MIPSKTRTSPPHPARRLAIQCRIRDAGKIRIIDVNGRLVWNPDEALGKAVKSLLAEGHRQIIVNLKKVPMVDSGGFGELAVCLKRVRDKEGGIRLVKAKGQFPLVMETLLELMFSNTMFAEELKAVGSF